MRGGDLGTANDEGQRPTTRVLVVEADRLAAAALASLLRSDGHDVVVEYTARAAVRQAVRHRPDVVVADVHLPAGDGLELVERLLLVPAIAEHHVVVLTGDDAAAEAARELGAEHLLTGRIDPSELREMVARVADATPARHIVPGRSAAMDMLRELGSVSLDAAAADEPVDVEQPAVDRAVQLD
ncbi:MAG: response regulator [Actinomycetota bacterium]